MDAVEGKNKASHSDFFWAVSNFFTESFRFSFPGEWHVWLSRQLGREGNPMTAARLHDPERGIFFFNSIF